MSEGIALKERINRAMIQPLTHPRLSEGQSQHRTLQARRYHLRFQDA